MDDARLYGRGIAFPVRLGPDGRVAWSAGPSNIREAIRVILLTEQGERLQRPEFGGRLRAYLFQPNTTSTRRQVEDDIGLSLKRWEPRITVQSVVVAADETDARAAIATIQYELVATRASEQVSVRVQLNG
jgi:phage baseplate assembly protein W